MELKIAFCGDIMLGGEVAKSIGTQTVANWLTGVSGAWSKADLLIGNLECPCVETAMPVEAAQPEIIFHAPASRLKELAQAGFSALSLANNHILNCGPLGLLETIQGLDKVGIHHAGAGMNLAEALQPSFIPVGSLTIGLVAFCYGPPAGRSSPGVAPCESRLMRKGLTAARKGADLVIAAVHDGLEYSDVPPSRTRALFRFLAENGADIVVGHHPHVLQGLEWYGQIPIAYSLGDFLFDNSLPHVAERNFARIAMGLYAPEQVRRDPEKFGRGAVLTVHISGKQKSTQWHPFRQDSNLRPELSSGNTRIEDLRMLEDLSAALLDKKDPRHALADFVFETARWKGLDNLGIRQFLNCAMRPKWRYLGAGSVWLHRRLSRLLRNG